MRNNEHTTSQVAGGDLTSVIQRLGGTVIDLRPRGCKRLDPFSGLSETGGCVEDEQRPDRGQK